MPIPKRVLKFAVEVAGQPVDTPDGVQHGEPVTLPAYQEERHVTVNVEGGTESVSTVQVWVDLADINLGDEVTVTRLSTGRRQTLRVLAVDHYEGSRRASHTAMKLG